MQLHTCDIIPNADYRWCAFGDFLNSDDLVLFIFCLAPLLTGPALFMLARVIRRRPAGGNKSLVLLWNFISIFFLFSCIVLISEIYFRFIYDTTDSYSFTKTSQAWTKRHVSVNNTGIFRESIDYRRKKQAGRRRITFVGDSFTEGHGINNVDNRFAGVIRKMRGDLEIHVVAVGGLDTGREIELLSRYMYKYETDLVVLVYVLNDICDILPEFQSLEKQALSYARHVPVPARHSFFLNTVYYRLTVYRDPSFKNYFSFIKDGYDGRIWDEQQKRLSKLAGLVHNGGGRLAVVTFPFLQSLGADYPFRHIHEKMDIFWKSMGIPHLDLLNIFEGHNPKKLVVNPYDAHPNEKAHALAAEAMVQFIDSILRNDPL